MALAPEPMLWQKYTERLTKKRSDDALFFFLNHRGWTLGVPMGKSARNKKLSEAVESLHDKWYSEAQNHL